MDGNEDQRRQLGEIIAASYSSFTGESYELNSIPALGSLVVAQDVLGVVAAATTEGLGPISAKGSADDQDGEVYNVYPELQRTLRSQFTAIVVGCYVGGQAERTLYSYPNCPPKIHYKCWQASTQELADFTSQPDYLRLLLNSPDGAAANIDQVLIHLIVNAFHARGDDRQWLSSTAEYLGRQLKGQYDRLLAILKTIDALMEEQYMPSNDSLHAAVGNVRI